MSEQIALEVEGECCGPERALRDLVTREGMGALRRLARERLITRLATREGVSVTREAVQAAVDEWRYARHLERTEDTRAWLAANGATLAGVAERLRCQMVEAALSHKVTRDRIVPYFAAHSLDFDEVSVSWICRSDPASAGELVEQVREEGADFHGLARRYSEDEATRPSGGYLGRLRRHDLPKGVSPLVFATAPGSVVGPLGVGGRFGLYLTEAAHPACLDDRVRSEIRVRLFGEWLTEELTRARIAFPMFDGSEPLEASAAT